MAAIERSIYNGPRQAMYAPRVGFLLNVLQLVERTYSALSRLYSVPAAHCGAHVWHLDFPSRRALCTLLYCIQRQQ
jgi:hypothetical protein